MSLRAKRRNPKFMFFGLLRSFHSLVMTCCLSVQKIAPCVTYYHVIARKTAGFSWQSNFCWVSPNLHSDSV